MYCNVVVSQLLHNTVQKYMKNERGIVLLFNIHYFGVSDKVLGFHPSLSQTIKQ